MSGRQKLTNSPVGLGHRIPQARKPLIKNKRLNSRLQKNSRETPPAALRCSSCFTAVARVTVGEDEGETPLPPKVKEWIEKNKPPLTEDEIKTRLEKLIRTMLFPVLALRGADITHETAWKDMRSIFREEHGMRITESDIKKAIEDKQYLPGKTIL